MLEEIVYQPCPRYGHCSLTTRKKIIIWGGIQKDISTNHSSPNAIRFASQVDIFNVYTGKWQNVQTKLGTPHPGIGNSGSACIGNKLYFIGGGCGNSSCLHNELTELDTSTMQWERIVATNPMEAPMPKNSHGVVAFQRNGENFLCVFGGFTAFSLRQQPQQSYSQNPVYPSLGWTGELHLFNLQTRTWSTPPTTGERPPPCSNFSFSLIAPDKALLLGGFQNGRQYVNDIYIINFTGMHWRKIASPRVPWRNGIGYHSASCIDGPLFGQQHPLLLVIGGKDSNKSTVKEAWLFDIDRNNWMKVPIPTKIISRLQHSACVVKFSPQCIHLVLFGGISAWMVGQSLADQPMKADTAVIEMIKGMGDEWLVSRTWDQQELSSREYLHRISKRMIEAKEILQQTARDTQQRMADLQQRLAQLQQRERETDQLVHMAERRAEDAQQQRQRALQIFDRVQRQLRENQDQHQQLQAELDANRQRANVDQVNLWEVQRYDVHLTEEVLGRGGWGEVRVATYCGLKVAAKHLHNLIVSPHNQDLFSREMNIATQLRHPNLVQIIGATVHHENERNIITCILMELMPTNLRAHLEQQQLTQNQVISIGIDVALALNYLHKKTPHPIIHRDISSANVLLQSMGIGRWMAKVSDFGTAKFIHQVVTPGPGAAIYAAPEVGFPDQHSPKMDVFSFGILLIEMQNSRLPNINEREHEVEQMLWPALEAVVRHCIAREANNRPEISIILNELRGLPQ